MGIVCNKLRENANWIVSKRRSVDFSPKDFEKVNAFLAAERVSQSSPLSKFVQSEEMSKIICIQLADSDGQKGKNGKAKNENGKLLKSKQKKKRMKKMNKLKSKMEKEKARKKSIADEKSEAALKKNYQSKSGDQNIVISVLGDVIKDFELSD